MSGPITYTKRKIDQLLASITAAFTAADSSVASAAATDATSKANAAQAAAIQRANHTGTQTRSTISDLGSIAAFSGDQNLRTTDDAIFNSVRLGASGFLRGGTNLIEQRNGTNGQIARWYKTFTSATNGEWCEIDAAGNASNFDIAVCNGSAGGTLRGLRFGAKSAGGAFSPWLSFDTSGNMTVGASSILPIVRHPTAAFSLGAHALFGVNRAQMAVGGHLGLAAAFGAEGAIDTRLCRVGAGQGAILASTSTADSTTLGDWFMRDMICTPSASRTLATNGQATFERVSDTQYNFVVRGSDGTTRRFAMTLS